MIIPFKSWKALNLKSKKKRHVKKQDSILVNEKYVDYAMKKAKKLGLNVDQAKFDAIYGISIAKVFGSYSNTFKNLALDESRPIMEVHLEQE